MEITAIEKNYLKIYGTFGSFHTPNAKYTIRVFSTFANNNKSKGLLEELKPMRERLNSSKIKDLGSLLQRDLNDSRVANQLVPYLLGQEKNPIAFFPSILGVLMPKEFINTDSESEYPGITSILDEKNHINYYWTDKWFAHIYKDDKGQESPLGILNIDLSQTEIVVIDGQHRANAFRVATNTFPDKEKGIYKPFYENIAPSLNLEADLPVTIIWFETPSSSQIDPKLISRRLFVDVNNTAKSVSNARKILLNDRDPIALLTRFFYSRIAESKGFSTSTFSLLHAAFDSDSDISKGEFHALTITSPDIIYDVFEKIFFKSWWYNKLRLENYYVSRSSNNIELSKFSDFFSDFRRHVQSAGEDDENLRVIIDENQVDNFRDKFNADYCDILMNLIDEFTLFKNHFKASSILGENRQNTVGDWASEQRQDVWDKVFCGGEGLYYSYKTLRPNSESLKQINNSIENIESEFKKNRFQNIDNRSSIDQNKVDKAYQSLRTKAFQIGYFMAFFDYAQQYDDLKSAQINFIDRLNSFSISNWIYIVTDLRSKIIGETMPKSWPAYHKIILRLIQSEKSKSNRYFLDEKGNSPEAYIYKKLLKEWCESYLKSNGFMPTIENFANIDPRLLNERSKEIIDDIDSLFRLCNISPMREMEGVYESIKKNILNLDNAQN